MKTTHPAATASAPVDYTREEIELLASASAQVRAAAHSARYHGLEFTLENPDVSSVVLTIQDPTRPRRNLRITMTRKSPSARPAHEVIHVMGYTTERLQVAQIISRVRDMIERKDAYDQALQADAVLVDPEAGASR